MSDSKSLSYSKAIALMFMVYFFSYAMRYDLSASLLAVIEDLKITNTEASYAITGSLVTYGVGQVFSGFIGDRVSPIKMISLAMLGTVLVNVLVSFAESITFITVLWCFNGIFQAMIYPPLCRLLADQTGDRYADAITIVGLSSSVGTIFVYLSVPVILQFTIWRNIFRCMAFFGAVMVGVWLYSTKGVKTGSSKPKVSVSDKKHGMWYIVMISGLIPILMIILLQGALRDGLHTWLPSLYNDRLELSAALSILGTSFLPIVSMISVVISNVLYHKVKSEIKAATVMFSVAAAATVPLALGFNMPVVITVILASVVSGCIHGVNNMIIGVLPKRFEKYGMMSTFTGIINAFAYMGAAVSTLGFAVLSDNFGWNSVLVSWFVIALSGTLLCICIIRKWSKFISLE